MITEKYKIGFNNTRRILLPTEKLIIKKISKNIENDFSDLSPKDDCLSYTDDGLVDGIQIASKSKYYCTAHFMDENEEVTAVDLKNNIEKIKKFAKLVIMDIVNGSFRDIITQKNTENYTPHVRQKVKNVVDENLGRLLKAVSQASVLANQILDVLKKNKLIETKGEAVERMGVNSHYIYHMNSEPRVTFKTKFMPVFRKYLDFQITQLQNVESKNEVIGLLKKIDDLLN